MDDSAIIELFFARSEQAIRELDDKYGKVCYSLSYNILNSRQDAEECVNDAYLGTWDAIPPARPNPLLAFLCRIVRNLSLMRYHADRAAKRGGGSYTVALEELEGCLATPCTVEGSIEEQELVRLIEDFLDTLSPENRVLLMRRYWFSDSYGEIAARTGLSEKNVSVRLTRIRKQLRHYFEERGVVR
ncbi:RNA polymerase sigma factor [Lawsonibacter sp. JLR.KK007]|uniref:RNA polymerase sigma factor n=1 Tax=Lawsonibacter sp. JLR.KK007 TaxID=3114293 RepID=UPI002FF1164F